MGLSSKGNRNISLGDGQWGEGNPTFGDWHQLTILGEEDATRKLSDTRLMPGMKLARKEEAYLLDLMERVVRKESKSKVKVKPYVKAIAGGRDKFFMKKQHMLIAN